MSITARELFTYKSDTRLPGEVSVLETLVLSREEGSKEVEPDTCLSLRSLFFLKSSINTTEKHVDEHITQAWVVE